MCSGPHRPPLLVVWQFEDPDVEEARSYHPGDSAVGVCFYCDAQGGRQRSALVSIASDMRLL